LQIDELSGTYSGAGDVARNAFCQLLFESSYKSINGRGYVVMKPMQKEKRQFHPSLLSSLPRVSVSLLRPNGMLFNQSRDDYSVWQVLWEAVNPQYLKIVTTKWFDKNEFYFGDNIRVQNFSIGKNDGTVPQYYHIFTAFINRSEGHDVLQTGQPNDRGFYQNFYIQAPGEFDSDTGKFVVDNQLVGTDTSALNEFNIHDQNDRLQPYNNGSIVNVSLQVAVGLRVGVSIDDV
jgi:hypothetical protein